MDQKRLLLAIAISLAIMLGFQFVAQTYFPKPAPVAQTTGSNAQPTDAPNVAATTAAGTPVPAGSPVSGAAPANVAAIMPAGPTLAIDAPRLTGSIALTGALFDNLSLRDYHETIAKNSPLVQLLSPPGGDRPSYTQFGWNGPAGVKMPDTSTLWHASAPSLTPNTPVTLSWDNGAGLTFQLLLAVDDNYMFTVTQSVINHTGAPVDLYPWSRVVRDYKPADQGTQVLYVGPEGVFNDTLHQDGYNTLKNDAKHVADGQAYTETSTGGWIGITDRYWLTALAPAQNTPLTGSMFYNAISGGDGNAYQTSFITAAPITAAPGGQALLTTHLFTGAKTIHVLDAYESDYGIPNLDKSIDFGHLYIITKPIFFALDYLNTLLGNFGLAIMLFTVGVKLLFFPLANYSYRSMGKMRLVQPKIAAIRAQYKDDQTKQQQAIMGLYKTEKINPASGCLPMIVQIPVFFALYKVISITIETRQAPFYGWIHDLSVPDPTNIFNLFGALPFDPTAIYAPLHLGALPIIMGFTMFLQQRLNPAPPDPVQARLFQFMPVIFTFVLANSPAGLVLYWAWNNLLSVGQQWLIMRGAKLPNPAAAKITSSAPEAPAPKRSKPAAPSSLPLASSSTRPKRSTTSPNPEDQSSPSPADQT
jgi:YidC/Oxa1 family membrane protein insertase